MFYNHKSKPCHFTTQNPLLAFTRPNIRSKTLVYNALPAGASFSTKPSWGSSHMGLLKDLIRDEVGSLNPSPCFLSTSKVFFSRIFVEFPASFHSSLHPDVIFQRPSLLPTIPYLHSLVTLHSLPCFILFTFTA